MPLNWQSFRALPSPSSSPQRTDQALATFEKERIMAVIRVSDTDDAIWGGRLLLQHGFKILDVTLGTPGAEKVIEVLGNEFPEALIGAGTVLRPRDAMSALAAGASFLASPVLDTDMLLFGTEYKLLVLPGVATPTEMYTAMHSGARALKFFPAEPIGGAAYLKTVLAPLPELSIVATGGVTLENMTAYLEAGALAVGLGNFLLPAEALKKRDEPLIIKRAQEAISLRDKFLNTQKK